MNEVINPRMQDQRSAMNNQFAGMTSKVFDYAEYENVRIKLIKTIQQSLTGQSFEHQKYRAGLEYIRFFKNSGYSLFEIKKVYKLVTYRLLYSSWCEPGSNRRHKDFQSFALPTELPHHPFLLPSLVRGLQK